MKVRTITALVIIAVVVPLTYLGGWYSVLLMALFIGGGVYELMNVRTEKEWPKYFRVVNYVFAFAMLFWGFIIHFVNTGIIEIPPDFLVHINTVFICMYLAVLLSFEVTHHTISIMDVFYIFTITLLLVVAGQAFFFIRNTLGILTIIYVLLVTYSNDTFALLIGTKWGKHKLAPVISPKKTWEGAIGGAVGATLIGTLYYLIFPLFASALNIFYALLMSFILAIGAIFGDLIFSSIKRFFKIKDFGAIFPGHGGILDRVDSLLFNLMVFISFYALITGGMFI
ncbi:MAG: CDP-archaeol synthase [Bacilli bacterium]|nr:CDP-archaeol synthase [Bacilli bacterium]MDD4584505.1 CDP-archaeol synthase [Bacilli bacterium]